MCLIWVQSDAEKESLRAQVLSSEEALACALRWQQDCLRYTVERAGVWIEPNPHVSSLAASSGPSMPEQLLPASGFVSLCGIKLPCRGNAGAVSAAAQSRGPFVRTETVDRNLEAAALVLCQQRPLLLEGPPGEILAVACPLTFFGDFVAMLKPAFRPAEDIPEMWLHWDRFWQVRLAGGTGSRHRQL